MLRRAYTPIEERMLGEYVAERLAGRPCDVHLRVGCPEGLEPTAPDYVHRRRFLLGLLPEADLVYREGGLVHVVEFGVWRPQTKVGQLLTYRVLLPDTPGYQDVDVSRIRLRIVVGRPEPLTETVAAETGCEVEVWTRPWLTKALADRTGWKKPTGVRLR